MVSFLVYTKERLNVPLGSFLSSIDNVIYLFFTMLPEMSALKELFSSLKKSDVWITFLTCLAF